MKCFMFLFIKVFYTCIGSFFAKCPKFVRQVLTKNSNIEDPNEPEKLYQGGFICRISKNRGALPCSVQSGLCRWSLPD